jgi:hypothetical protein
MYANPHMRLAEVYLIFAEAANEAYGPTTIVPNTTMSAQTAINVVRARAGMPGINAKFLNTIDFRNRVENENAVEFFGEGHRWFDIRRLHVAHLDKYKKQYKLTFPKTYTSFTKELITTRIFEERHYWLPFTLSDVQIYSGFKQNPGW